jgi:tetratricopeptide (TPR) repeat protein
MHLTYFDAMAERRQADLRGRWLSPVVAGLIGATGPGEPAATGTTLVVRLHFCFTSFRDAGPPESLLLAVRAARRALAADPEDGGAWLLLGESYLRLASQTREQSWGGAMPALAAIRRAQALTALENAVLLGPEFDRAHALLGQLYYESGQLDRALDHLRARLRICHATIKARGPGAEAASERRAALEASVASLEASVQRAQDIYQANISDETRAPSKVAERASLASRHGLSRMALEMLLESQLAIFGKSGAQMQLELMIQAGRAAEVRAWVGPEHESVLGFSRCHWLLAQAAAACGDYAAADAELDRISEQLRLVRVSAKELLPVRSAVAFRVGEAALAFPVRGTGPPGLASAAYLQFRALRPLDGPGDLLRQEADVRVLRGVLALEAGAVETARAHFRAALDVWGSASQSRTGGGLDFPARPVAEHGLRLLTDDRP